MRLASWFLMAALAAGLVACSDSGPQAVTPVLAASEPTGPPVASPPATPPKAGAVVASGPLLVEDQVDVSTQRAGVVAQLLVDVGQTVRRGEQLATLDDRQLTAERDAAQAQVQVAQANLKDWQAETRMAEADFRRAEGMFKAQLNTQEQLDHARYKWQGSVYEIEKGQQELLQRQAALRAVSLELEKTHIRAPFDGVIARRYVRLGQEVASGDRLFWVTAVRPLRVKFTLPEKLIGQVKRGQIVSVSCLDEPGATHQARILQVSPVVDPSSGTFEVLAQLVNPGPNLRPGMTANIRLGNVR